MAPGGVKAYRIQKVEIAKPRDPQKALNTDQKICLQFFLSLLEPIFLLAFTPSFDEVPVNIWARPPITFAPAPNEDTVKQLHSFWE